MRQGDACGLEDVADIPADMGASDNDLAVLLDGGLLEAIEIVEERLPFGLDAFLLTHAHEMFRQGQGDKGAKYVAADGSVGLVEDGPGIEAGLGNMESLRHLCNKAILRSD